MRTTLTLDDDLLDLVREEAARTRRSVRQVLNERLRLGFKAPAPLSTARRFKVEPLTRAGFAPGIDERKLNQLADVLDAEDVRRR